MDEATILEELREVAINRIVVNPFQPRRQFSQPELEELAASILSVGLIHPPVVRPCDNGDGFELISGERRFRASQLAGFTSIPVLIRSHSRALSAQAALIENIQRVDLNPMEIAKALKMLADQFGLNQEELACRVGKKRSTVANYMRLLTLPQNIQDSVMQNVISMGHAKAILSLEGSERQNHLHYLVLKNELTVRETEETAQRLVAPAKSTPITPPADVYLEDLAGKLQEKLGTKVLIQGKDGCGRISIDYYSLDDLDRVLQLIGIENS